jgi:hypothetical protein
MPLHSIFASQEQFVAYVIVRLKTSIDPYLYEGFRGTWVKIRTSGLRV